MLTEQVLKTVRIAFFLAQWGECIEGDYDQFAVHARINMARKRRQVHKRAARYTHVANTEEESLPV